MPMHTLVSFHILYFVYHSPLLINILSLQPREIFAISRTGTLVQTTQQKVAVYTKYKTQTRGGMEKVS